MAEEFIQLDPEGLKNLQNLAKKLGPEELWKRMLQRMDRLAEILAGKVVRNSLSGQLLKRRTGALARSVTGKSLYVDGLPAIRVGIFRGPATVYAGIQESGGTIYPKRARALAVPVNEALTPAGVERYGGPRNYPGKLRFIPFRRGMAVGALVDEQEAAKAERQGIRWTFNEVKPLYLLMLMVKLPATRWLSKPMRDNVPFVAEELAAYLKETIRDA